MAGSGLCFLNLTIHGDGDALDSLTPSLCAAQESALGEPDEKKRAELRPDIFHELRTGRTIIAEALTIHLVLLARIRSRSEDRDESERMLRLSLCLLALASSNDSAGASRT